MAIILESLLTANRVDKRTKLILVHIALGQSARLTESVRPPDNDHAHSTVNQRCILLASNSTCSASTSSMHLLDVVSVRFVASLLQACHQTSTAHSVTCCCCTQGVHGRCSGTAPCLLAASEPKVGLLQFARNFAVAQLTTTQPAFASQ